MIPNLGYNQHLLNGLSRSKHALLKNYESTEIYSVRFISIFRDAGR